MGDALRFCQAATGAKMVSVALRCLALPYAALRCLAVCRVARNKACILSEDLAGSRMRRRRVLWETLAAAASLPDPEGRAGFGCPVADVKCDLEGLYMRRTSRHVMLSHPSGCGATPATTSLKLEHVNERASFCPNRNARLWTQNPKVNSISVSVFPKSVYLVSAPT